MMTMSLRKRVPKSIAVFGRIVGKSQVFASLRNAGSRTEAASAKQSVLSSDCVHRQRLGWRSTHARKSMSSWVIMQDGFLISAGARTLSVIAQSSCEAEHIAATAATSEAKYIQALFLACGQHVKHPSAFRQLWRHWCGKGEEVCNGCVIWTFDFCGCKRRPPTRTFESARCLGLRTWLTLTRILADARSLEFCRSKMGVTEIPKHFRDAVL